MPSSSAVNDASSGASAPSSRSPMRNSCGSPAFPDVCAFHATSCSASGPLEAIVADHGVAGVPFPATDPARPSSATSSPKYAGHGCAALSSAARCSAASAAVGCVANFSGSTSAIAGSAAGSTSPASAARCVPAPAFPSAARTAALTPADSAVFAFVRSIVGYVVPPSATFRICSDGTSDAPFHSSPATIASSENAGPGAISGCDGSPGAATASEAAGTADGDAAPASGSENSVTLASTRAGAPAPGASETPTRVWSSGVTPSAAVVCANARSTDDDAFGEITGNVHTVLAVVVATTGAVTPSSPARCWSHVSIGAGEPATSARSHAVSALGSLAIVANGNAGTEPS